MSKKTRTPQFHEETRKISKLARSAAQMIQVHLQGELARAMDALAVQTLESMTLSPKDGWVVDFGRGIAMRRRVLPGQGP